MPSHNVWQASRGAVEHRNPSLIKKIETDALPFSWDFRPLRGNANWGAGEGSRCKMASQVQSVEALCFAGSAVVVHGRRVPTFVDRTRDDDADYAGHCLMVRRKVSLCGHHG